MSCPGPKAFRTGEDYRDHLPCPECEPETYLKSITPKDHELIWCVKWRCPLTKVWEVREFRVYEKAIQFAANVDTQIDIYRYMRIK